MKLMKTFVLFLFRFNFLHHKLSHIKRLVSEFDTTLTNGNGDDANANY